MSGVHLEKQQPWTSFIYWLFLCINKLYRLSCRKTQLKLHVFFLYYIFLLYYKTCSFQGMTGTSQKEQFFLVHLRSKWGVCGPQCKISLWGLIHFWNQPHVATEGTAELCTHNNFQSASGGNLCGNLLPRWKTLLSLCHPSKVTWHAPPKKCNYTSGPCRQQRLWWFRRSWQEVRRDFWLHLNLSVRDIWMNSYIHVTFTLGTQSTYHDFNSIILNLFHKFNKVDINMNS